MGTVVCYVASNSGHYDAQTNGTNFRNFGAEKAIFSCLAQKFVNRQQLADLFFLLEDDFSFEDPSFI